jgi:phenylacetate-coenzyme A ligase PaaK-like adenylate-forming protein
MKRNDILSLDPYSLDKESKRVLLNTELKRLTVYHYNNCLEYRKIFDKKGININCLPDYENIPFIPVGLFKSLDLKSIPQENILKTMTSSGTTGQQVSRIYIDKNTSSNQTKVLAKIVTSFLGKKRMPMLIIDSVDVLKNRNMFSARGAGILGFSVFGTHREYLLDNNMQLDIQFLKDFLAAHQGEPIFLFGFTYMIWLHFYKQLVDSGYHPDLSNAILIHGGGWKKLENEQVSSSEFKHKLHDLCQIDIKNIHDYYGMVEQTGTIYMECEYGHFHSSAFSDIIVRDPINFNVLPVGKQGVIEVVSILPESYPGHIILTEDEGYVLGEDDCPCGRKGKYFKIEGRIKNAEIRGCSDTYGIDTQNQIPIKYIVGDASTIEGMGKLRYFEPFSENAINFLNDLSKLLLISGKEFSDVATFGFWCRKAALIKEKEKFGDLSNRVGRGIVFHSTPSNVPVNFAFSFASSLLAGNANIVRLPAKDFPQVTIICNAISQLVNTNHIKLAPYICMVSYPTNIEVTNKFSSICNSRVIWGGDGTIEEIRKSSLKPRSNEITFADRYSIALINAEVYLQNENKTQLAKDFYNDTYFSDQNACTSPRIIIWIGENIVKAKEEFWKNLQNIISKKNYSIAPVHSIGKLSALYKAISKINTQDVVQSSPFISRITINQLDDSIMDYKYHSGFFFEYNANDLESILPICTEKCQTLSYFGFTRDELKEFFEYAKPHGIDRAVPIGKSMDFSLIWDGIDLIRTLSRQIEY